MPTYEYACPTCDATHEVQQKMTDPTLTDCPVCGQPGVRKLFTGVGIHFKGSGFYRTDSRDSKSSATSTAKAGSTSGSEGTAGSSGSSTPSGSGTGSSNGSGGSGSGASSGGGASSASTKAGTPA